jgi:hypothetical protein
MDGVLEQGSGPFGIPLARDVRRLTAKLETSLGRSWPQIRELLEVAGAVEARQILLDGLLKRATARFVKLMFGPTPQKNPPKQLAERSTAAPMGTRVEFPPPLLPAPRAQI